MKFYAVPPPGGSIADPYTSNADDEVLDPLATPGFRADTMDAMAQKLRDTEAENVKLKAMHQQLFEWNQKLEQRLFGFVDIAFNKLGGK